MKLRAIGRETKGIKIIKYFSHQHHLEISMALAGKGKKRTTDAKSKSHSKKHKSSSTSTSKAASTSTVDSTEILKKSTSAFASDKPAKDKTIKKGHKAIEVVAQPDGSDDSEDQGGMDVDEDLEADFLMSLDVKGMTVYALFH